MGGDRVKRPPKGWERKRPKKFNELSAKKKKKTFESVVRPQSKGLLHERKFFFSFFLIILLPETTFVIREWNRKCRIFHQPKRQQRIHLSGLFKKKNDSMYIFDHEVHAQPCGAKRGRKVGDRYASLYSPFDG